LPTSKDERPRRQARAVREGEKLFAAMHAGELPREPRERLARLGPQALKDEELLALALGTGYRGRHVMALAASILADHPKEQLVDMDLVQLSRIKGLGKAKGGAWSPLSNWLVAVCTKGWECDRSLLLPSTCCRFWPISGKSGASTFCVSISTPATK
jgi:hypothetical protein